MMSWKRREFEIRKRISQKNATQTRNLNGFNQRLNSHSKYNKLKLIQSNISCTSCKNTNY